MSEEREERAHVAALWRHNRAWEAMHDIGVSLGRDSERYAEARARMLEARTAVTRAHRKTQAKRAANDGRHRRNRSEATS